MAKHLLTDLRIRKAKPKDKPYRLFDGGGLALLVSPTGVKSWQLRYRHYGKEQTATLGKLDRLTLAQARIDADKARRIADSGEHLTVAKRVERATRAAANASTFKSMAAAWVKSESKRKRWTGSYIEEVEQSLANHLGELSALPISRIVASITAPILNSIEKTAPAMEEKVSRRLHAIMDYAVESGVIVANPLPRRRRSRQDRKNYAAVTDLAGIGAIMRAARSSDPCKGIARAHLLLAFTAQRISEIVGATWAEFELDGADVPINESQHTKRDPSAGNWSIPRERMKRKDAGRGPHVVPLPPALLATLREWHKEDGGDAQYVCTAPRDPGKQITPEAVEKHYRNALGLGDKHSPHSWRAAFSTVCREAGKDSDSIEAQLDHVVGNKVAAAYDRARRLELRRELMRWYEATLIAARDGASVVSISDRRAV